MPNKVRVVVLNDGETFTDLEGCAVLSIELPDGSGDVFDNVEAAVKAPWQGCRPDESVTLDNGVRVTLDDGLDERMGNDV